MDKLWMLESLLVIFLLYLLFKPRPSIRMKKPKLGVPGAHIIYTDQKEDHHEEGIEYGTILYSEKYDLRGKPDYIFQKRITGKLIPVELKSAELSDEEWEPRAGDLMQLAAYFLIIEDLYGQRPKEGRLIYSNAMFVVKNTRKIRRRVKRTIKDMRDMLKTGEQEVDPSFVKCRYCICRETVCEHYEYGKNT